MSLLVNSTLKSIVGQTLRKSNGSIIVVPVPQNASVSPSPQFEEAYENNCQGVSIRQLKRTRQLQFEVSIEYGYKTFELMCAAMARDTSALSGNVDWGYASIKAPAGTSRTIPAAASGYFGQGLSADPTAAKAFALINGISVELTRAAHTNFDFASTKGFSIGAAGAIKLSDDIPEGTRISIYGGTVAVGTDARQMASDLGLVSTVLYLVNQDQRLIQVSFSATIDPQQISFGQANQSINYSLSGEPTFRSLDLLYPCLDS